MGLAAQRGSFFMEEKDMKAALKDESMKKRVKKLLDERQVNLEKVDDLHVRLQPGNRKTGKNCWTVSLLPVIDCANCAKCKHNCYDLKNDLIYPAVINDRVRNSAIHKSNRERYWQEIAEQVVANQIMELRLNVGGDLDDEDFKYVAALGEGCRIGIYGLELAEQYARPHGVPVNKCHRVVERVRIV